MLTALTSWLIAYKLLLHGILHDIMGNVEVTVDIRPLLYAALALLYSTASGLESMTRSR